MLFEYHEKEPTQIITKDTPRKKGFARFIEVVERDALSFWKASVLLTVSGLPLCIGLWITLNSNNFFLLLLISSIGGILVGPQLSGLTDTILRSLRDEPSFWWHTYRIKWKENVTESILPGMMTGLILGTEFYVLANIDRIVLGAGLFLILWIAFLFITSLLLLIWMQLSLMKLQLLATLKNAVLLVLISPLRCIGAATMQLLYWGICWLFLPYSLAVFLIIGIWFPCAISFLILYQPVEKSFRLEQRIREKTYLS